MIYDKFSQITDDRIVASLIGMPKAKFTALVKVFESAALAIDRERVEKGEIKHVKQGGPKGYLDSYEKKLFFVLYYLKTYPTFDVLGFHFGFSGGHAHAHIDRLLPVLGRALTSLNVMPERTLTITSRMIIYPEGVMLGSKLGAFSRRYSVRPSKVHHHADSSS
ncbi:helix-turn-helix domain-containing protein [Methylocaldum szegediense]|uniref:Transposase Helix-turn-helix domain-containing protein n=1 Tax=Methylocaldum szegediense TaxID=73780 RepID=A0ABM9I6S1_9GAMM|nr:transposase family protein [Methylocaldum szegediense]CAI8926479.1 protein of unknown function [Methylocaldum szegediense]